MRESNVEKHELFYCKENPHRQKRTLSEEHKKKISTARRRMMQEGPEHSGWTQRWALKQSYPEKWFTSVIENEFSDKNYIHEMRFYQYALDFAWPHKQRCIEIDGEQHYKNLERSELDKKRDALCEEKGWKVLRIRWKDCVRDKSAHIQMARTFIDSGKIIPVENRWKTEREKKRLKKIEMYGHERIRGNELSLIEKNRRFDLIQSYNKSEYGWINKACTETGLTKRQIQQTCDHFGIEWRTSPHPSETHWRNKAKNIL
jgi:very-short-patch-repair endonuclease